MLTDLSFPGSLRRFLPSHWMGPWVVRTWSRVCVGTDYRTISELQDSLRWHRRACLSFGPWMGQTALVERSEGQVIVQFKIQSGWGLAGLSPQAQVGMSLGRFLDRQDCSQTEARRGWSWIAGLFKVTGPGKSKSRRPTSGEHEWAIYTLKV